MAAVIIRHLISPSESDISVLIDINGKAFENDRFTHIVLSGDNSLRPAFAEPMIRAGLIAGEVYVAHLTEDPSKTVGYAVWFPPGRDMYDSEDQREFQKPFIARCPPELQKWWGEDFIPKLVTFLNASFGAGIGTDAWHLDVLATLPEYQGKGIGKQLIQVITDRAMNEGKNVCLECETELNAGSPFSRTTQYAFLLTFQLTIYGAQGFEKIGETRFTHEPYGDFPMFAMIKKPRTAT